MQTDAFAIRPLTLDDLDALLPLVEALHTGDGDPFDPQRTVDALQLVLSHPEYGVVHVAVVGETIAGYIVGSLGLSIEAGGRFLLVDELYISPAWREQGLACALLASLIPYAQSHHCRVVETGSGCTAWRTWQRRWRSSTTPGRRRATSASLCCWVRRLRSCWCCVSHRCAAGSKRGVEHSSRGGNRRLTGMPLSVKRDGRMGDEAVAHRGILDKSGL